MEETKTKRRRPVLAGLLSFLAPGLGQLYNGELKKGIVFFLIVTGLIIIPLLAGVLSTFYGLLLYGAVRLLCFFTVIIDAFLSARRIKAITPKSYGKWYYYILIFILHTALIATVEPSETFRSYRAPSASMSTTVEADDHFITELNPYKEKKPQRGDVVVFISPTEEGKDYMKRVIALAGESVAINDGVVFIDGEPITEAYANHSAKIPKGATRIKNFGPAKVPDGHLFLMGDNRNASYDSRHFGMIKTRDVLGKALYIYYSKDLSRVGTNIE